METDREYQRVDRKFVAALRAQFRLKQRFAAIDYELDVILPKRKELKEGLTIGVLPEITLKELPSGK